MLCFNSRSELCPDKEVSIVQRILAAVSLVGIVALSAILVKIPLNEEHVFRILSKATVKLTDERGSPVGTGFYYLGSNGTVLTLSAAHVCENERVMLGFKDRKKIGKFEVVRKDEEADLCLLHSDAAQDKIHTSLVLARTYKYHDTVFSSGYHFGRHLNPEKGRIIKHELSTIMRMPEAGTASCPAGFTLTFSFVSGIFCQKSIYTLATTIRAYPGDSGSAVVNRWGNVVGVVIVTSKGTDYAGIVPLENVRSFLANEDEAEDETN